jgi:hypothetical protein
LAGPDRDYDVTPQQIGWQVRIANVEWSIVSSDLDLGDWQDAGARVEKSLLVRFNGKTPFVLQLVALNATGSTATSSTAGAPIVLTAEQVDMPAVEVAGPANEAGLYEAPIALIARQAIPKDALRGTFYSGKLALEITGLPGEARSVNVHFHSPGLVQRYIAPYVTPVYSLPWVLCTGPLTAFLLLILTARIRSRGFNEEEIEQAAMAAVAQMAAPAAGEGVAPQPFNQPLSPPDEVWSNTEWSSPWGVRQEAVETARAANGASVHDSWSSSW